VVRGHVTHCELAPHWCIHPQVRGGQRDQPDIIQQSTSQDYVHIDQVSKKTESMFISRSVRPSNSLLINVSLTRHLDKMNSYPEHIFYLLILFPLYLTR
jgi:hypothetical protein